MQQDNNNNNNFNNQSNELRAVNANRLISRASGKSCCEKANSCFLCFRFVVSLFCLVFAVWCLLFAVWCLLFGVVCCWCGCG